jgi:hypothetical protein
VAFFALYWLNRSIRIQKEELTATKAELAESRIAQQQQVYTLEKQRFEDTFFSLLDQHNKVLEKFSEKAIPDPVWSRPNANSINGDICRSGLNLAEAKAMLQTYDELCGHYFRILYQLLKLVATKCPGTSLGVEFSAASIVSTTAAPEEKLYTNIVRAFLDVDVTQLLAINCFCEPDSTYWLYKCLVERYGLLEHMPFEFRGMRYEALGEAAEFYHPKAFDKSEFLSQVGM